jgi:hypothetical protein
MKSKIHAAPPLDLVEVRRQITALRSLHSHDPRATRILNEPLVKLIYLRKPYNRAHEEALRKLIAEAVENGRYAWFPRSPPFIALGPSVVDRVVDQFYLRSARFGSQINLHKMCRLRSDAGARERKSQVDFVNSMGFTVLGSTATPA